MLDSSNRATIPVRLSKIVIYSIECSEGVLRELPYHRYFEERSLCHLETLRQPDTRVVLITPRTIDPEVLNYHFQELYQMNVEQEHSARERLVLLSPQSQHLVPLANLVIEDTAILTSLEEEKHQVNIVRLINCMHSHKIESLGQNLNIPVEEGSVFLSQYWGSKAGSKEAFLKSNVPAPRGTTEIFKDINRIKDAVIKLATANPPCHSVMIKLNEGSWGDGLGNAVISCEKLLQTNDLSESVESLLQPWESFVREISLGGAIVEEYVAGAIYSPSGQGYIDDQGEVTVTSSHEQILVNGTYIGCSFPAPTQYIAQIYEGIEKVGKTLSAHGVRGTFGVDFIGFDNGQLLATEINLRKIGPSHVFAYVKSVFTNKIGNDGFLRNRNGLPVYYVHRRLYEPSLLKYLEPNMAIEVLRQKGLLYDHTTQTGTLLHILGALKPCGFVEITSVENNRDKALETDKLVQEVLLNEAKALRANL